MHSKTGSQSQLGNKTTNYISKQSSNTTLNIIAPNQRDKNNIKKADLEKSLIGPQVKKSKIEPKKPS